MGYILGTSFAEQMLVKKALTSFFGIGPNVCARLMARHHIHETAKVSDMTEKQVLNINASLSEMRIENDLRRRIWGDLERLKETGTYRGRRHAMNLPVRGQGTRTQ
ncbi:hypothetical protein KEM55_005453, partial [Ascosphaera atra]